MLNDSYGETAFHKAAWSGNVEVSEKLWSWSKELQLKAEDLKIRC
jgi:hypothetical protein